MGMALLAPCYHPDGARMMTYYTTSDTNHYLILFCLQVIWKYWLMLLGIKLGLCLPCVTHRINKAETESTGAPVGC